MTAGEFPDASFLFVRKLGMPEEAWLGLLQPLSSVSSFAVWKNADRVLAGSGDLDGLLPIKEWGSVTREFKGWAATHQLQVLPPCAHFPGVLLMTAWDATRGGFVEVDLADHQTLLGTPLFGAEQIADFCIADDRGFRKPAPVVERTLLILLDQLPLPAARAPLLEDDKARSELSSHEVEVLGSLVERLGLPPGTVDGLATSLKRGQLDRSLVRQLRRHFLLKTIAEFPSAATFQMRKRLGLQRCPLLRVVVRHAKVAPEQWLPLMLASHTDDLR